MLEAARALSRGRHRSGDRATWGRARSPARARRPGPGRVARRYRRGRSGSRWASAAPEQHEQPRGERSAATAHEHGAAVSSTVCPSPARRRSRRQGAVRTGKSTATGARAAPRTPTAGRPPKTPPSAPSARRRGPRVATAAANQASASNADAPARPNLGAVSRQRPGRRLHRVPAAPEAPHSSAEARPGGGGAPRRPFRRREGFRRAGANRPDDARGQSGGRDRGRSRHRRRAGRSAPVPRSRRRPGRLRTRRRSGGRVPIVPRWPSGEPASACSELDAAPGSESATSRRRPHVGHPVPISGPRHRGFRRHGEVG